jgi:hypothetical protein
LKNCIDKRRQIQIKKGTDVDQFPFLCNLVFSYFVAGAAFSPLWQQDLWQHFFLCVLLANVTPVANNAMVANKNTFFMFI